MKEAMETAAVPGAKPTAGQLVETPENAITALERTLISQSHKFGVEIGEQTESAIRTMNQAMREAVGSGDPGAVVALAQVRRQYYEALISTRVAFAERQLAEARGSIVPDTPDARATANKEARKFANDALADARAM